MAFRDVEKTRDKHCTFRTFPGVAEDLKDLAKKIDQDIYFWKYDHAIRLCNTRSGLIHQVMAGNITLSEIKDELKKREADQWEH